MLFTRLLAKSERPRSQFPLGVPVVFLPEDDSDPTKFNVELAARDTETVLVKVVVRNEPSSEPDYTFIGYGTTRSTTQP